MGDINLHISLTSFRNESRVLKETESIVSSGVAEKAWIVALHEDGLAEEERIDSARCVLRLRLATRRWPKSLIFQLCKYLEMAWRVVRIARAKQATIYNVHSNALMPIGVLLKLILGGKLVYDAHELETEADGLRGFRKRAAKWVERATIGFADLVIVVSPGIEEWYRRRYRGLSIVTVLNAPRHVAPQRSNLLRERLEIPARFRIAIYQGVLSANRSVNQLLDAAARMEDAGYGLVFMGYGPMQQQVEAAAARGSNVFFQPAVPPSEVLAYTASADVGISPIAGTSLSYNLSLPNKLFEYILAGIPVMTSAFPEMERIVREHGLGVCVADWNGDEIVDALKKIDAMRGAGLDARLVRAAAEYCWEKQEIVMIEAYQRMLGQIPVEASRA